MPAPERDRWSEWREIARVRVQAARVGLAAWLEAVREEPVLIWQTPAVRYTTYGLGGLLLFMFLRGAIGMLEPAGHTPEPQAKTAVFDVVCSNPQCGRHFAIERKFRFHRFPVTCPFCNQKTGQQALRCTSETCRGRLVGTFEQDGMLYCVECRQPIAPAP